jgi:hypothetical protein
MFKVGDYVICIDNSDTYTYECLKLGKAYIVSYVFDRILAVKGAEDISFHHKRFKKIEDNAVNRILYPEVNWGNNED